MDWERGRGGEEQLYILQCTSMLAHGAQPMAFIASHNAEV